MNLEKSCSKFNRNIMELLMEGASPIEVAWSLAVRKIAIFSCAEVSTYLRELSENGEVEYRGGKYFAVETP